MSLTLFNDFIENFGLKVFNLNTDVVKAALVTSTSPPTASTANPTWGAAGTNLSTNECSAGGNYSSGGVDINAVWTETSGTGKFDGDNYQLLQNAGNPTDASYLVLYSDTATNKECIGFVNLSGPVNCTLGDLNVTWDGAGIFTLS